MDIAAMLKNETSVTAASRLAARRNLPSLSERVQEMLVVHSFPVF
jgi:hypothetical protein